MDIDGFKQQFATELTGLTVARISTLWKKSKTLTREKLIEAIHHSKSAQDKQRRGKDPEPDPDHITPQVSQPSPEIVPVVVHEHSEPISAQPTDAENTQDTQPAATSEDKQDPLP